MATGRTPQVVNFKCINELLTPETEDTSLREHCVPFLPNNALKALVSRDRVEATLTKRFGFKGETKSIMANHVMKKAKKVFLVLLFTGMGKEHWETLQETAFKFADTCLPIKGKTAGPQDDKWAGSLVLDDRERKTFLADQWIFLAPTFRKADFTREFDRDRILPFVPIENAITYTGHFGTVYHLGLRLDHTEESPMSPTRDGVPKECIEVALKVTTVQRSKTTGTDVEKFYDKETHTLKLMRGFNHPHLIKAIAAYKKGHYRCFVFPWASGGSLKSLLQQGSRKLDKHMVTWAFNQILGICEGIEKLHAENVRHGDIKPLNILYFPENPNSGFAWGNLVVADVGLAKVHEEYTKERDPGTTTRHGTNMYQPPEMASFLPAKTTMSRKYDIWSLGCVFLECVVWLRHGPEGHKRLHDKFNASRVWRFWVLDSNGQWKLHKAVRSQIEELKRKFGNESALGRLVNLISKKLLVSKVHRTDAKNLVRDLKSIRSECRVGSLSDLAPNMEILANQTSGPLPQPEGDQDLDSPSNQVGGAG